MGIIAAKKNGDDLAPTQADLGRGTGLTTSLDEFTASIAHEVNQTLAAIVTNGENCLRWLGGEQPQVDRARANTAAMIRSALRSSDIIRRLRTLSTKADAQRKELSLNEVIEGVVPLIEPETRGNSVSLRLELAPDLPPVLGDRDQLQHVIINLLVHGIQAMPPVGERPRELLIRSRQHDVNEVVVVVQDNGNYIDPLHFDRLADAFLTSKSGMGIGLSICRSIIEAHGGRVWASRNSGHGATFHFALPLSENSPHSPAAINYRSLSGK